MRWSSMSDGVTIARARPAVLNVSELDPDWNWLAPDYLGAPLDAPWVHLSVRSLGLPGWLPRRDSIARTVLAWQACREAAVQRGVLVSHGPRPAFYNGLLMPSLCPQVHHFIYAFNFTELPRGAQRALMGRVYRRADRLITFSSYELDLYKEVFGLAPDRLQMMLWAAPPLPRPAGPALVQGDYLCAIGSQGRDYASLVEAMRRLPHRRLVIVGSPASLVGLKASSNVIARSDLPIEDVANILHHASLTVLPLQAQEVPCGHVTLVSAMHAGKAVIATDAHGLRDYLQHEENALLCRPRHPSDLTEAIERLLRDPDERQRLARAGQDFARRHCTVDHVATCFSRFLDELPSP